MLAALRVATSSLTLLRISAAAAFCADVLSSEYFVFGLATAFFFDEVAAICLSVPHASVTVT